jgi:glutamate-1-semialdehyde 2,1-aminomutase
MRAMRQDYLNGYDAGAIRERAKYVIENGKHFNQDALKRYKKYFDERCAVSKETIDAAKRFIPGGVQHNLALNHPFPLNIVKAEGAYLFDIDGNRYIDLLNGGGATILGNNYPPIREAVINVLNNTGSLTGLYHEYERKLAEKICSYYPSCDKFRMLGSGTEAVMVAIRLARAFTGKDRIVKLKGCYDGWSDHVVYDVRTVNTQEAFAVGIPNDTLRNTSAVMINDAEALERRFIENEKKGGTAAFIIEPIGQDSGGVPVNLGYHTKIRELCDKYGVLLIMDEVVTSFRLGMGGAQETFGVPADITVFGKIIAGGFASAGGVGARDEIMALVTPGVSHTAGKTIMLGGTLSANPVSCVAGYTAICELERTDAHEKLDKAAEKFSRDLADLANKYSVPAVITHHSSIMQIDITGFKHITTFEEYSDEVIKEKRAAASRLMNEFAMALVAEGVIVAGGNKTFLNLQTIDVLDSALASYERVFKELV